ncbi:MAG TPA: hypothetical protein VFY93_08930 [Planctomycetota bacterium]|nr:hypothetical protein [Planctomycetota bacterium]
MMSTGHNTSPSVRRREAAFSIIETLCGMTLMFVGLLSLASSTVTGMTTNETNRESARATCAARQFLESMQVGLAFEDLFAAYTATPVDLSGGGSLLDPITRPLVETATNVFRSASGELKPILSREFEVVGLKPTNEANRASMGEVLFPTAQGEAGLELREDVAGRDLNGDGVIDSENHAGDYKILPVTVRVTWRGTRGARELELQTILIRR